MLIQEERQRSVGLGNSVHIESTTLAVNGSNVNFNPNLPAFFANSGVFGGKNSKGRDRPICTHCGKLGHVMEKCFKLHGFPLGFKPKGKNFMVNQVNAQEACVDDDTSTNFLFTQEQCQQFLTMLGTQMQAAHLNSSGKETHFNLGNKETHMANSVIKPTSFVSSSSSGIDALTMAGTFNPTYSNLRHSVFSAQITH